MPLIIPEGVLRWWDTKRIKFICLIENWLNHVQVYNICIWRPRNNCIMLGIYLFKGIIVWGYGLLIILLLCLQRNILIFVIGRRKDVALWGKLKNINRDFKVEKLWPEILLCNCPYETTNIRIDIRIDILNVILFKAYKISATYLPWKIARIQIYY